MADPAPVQPPASPPVPPAAAPVVPATPAQTITAAATRLPSLIGILIVVCSFATFNAILFLPKPGGVNESVTQQIITIIAALLGAFVGWQFGSSQSSQRKDDTIAIATSKQEKPSP